MDSMPVLTKRRPRFAGVLPAGLVLGLLCGSASARADVKFRHHFVDRDLPGGSWEQERTEATEWEISVASVSSAESPQVGTGKNQP